MKNTNLFQTQGLNPAFGKDSYLNIVALQHCSIAAFLQITSF